MPRLIDADAFGKALEKEWDTNSDSDFANKCVWRALENAPTVEPEREKGKWYQEIGMMPPEFYGVYRCSECDEIAMRDWKHHKQTLTNFCPNCGCEMER